MRASETCTCGARVEIEDDDQAIVIGTIQRWHDTHRCGIDPWRRDQTSTTYLHAEMADTWPEPFGFEMRTR